MVKISVVGSGRVGGSCAHLLAQGGFADEVLLLDVEEGLPQGTALDIMQAAPLEGFRTKVYGSNEYDDIEGSDLVVVTAGLARKPGMSRLDLLRENARIVQSVAEKISRYTPHSKMLVVTNPLDVMTYLAFKASGFERNRVFGMGGVLDSARFAYFIAEKLGVALEETSALVIGAHGDRMLPLPRFSRVSGRPITELLPPDVVEDLVERTRGAGAEIVSHLKTGSAFHAPAASVVRMVEAIFGDGKGSLPVCVYLDGEYGLKDVCIGVPVKLGLGGVEEIIELDLTSDEMNILRDSAAEVRESIESLGLE